MPTAQDLLNGLLTSNGILDSTGKYSLEKAGISNKEAAATVLDFLAKTSPVLKEIGLGADSPYLGGIDKTSGAVIYNKDKPMLGPTALHEAIHAVQNKLFGPAAKSKAPELAQFRAAYADMQKAYKAESERQNAINDPNEPAKTKKFAEYRYSPQERLAFGANSLFSDTGANARLPHVDATAMTDFLVLADMLGNAKPATANK